MVCAGTGAPARLWPRSFADAVFSPGGPDPVKQSDAGSHLSGPL